MKIDSFTVFFSAALKGDKVKRQVLYLLQLFTAVSKPHSIIVVTHGSALLFGIKRKTFIYTGMTGRDRKMYGEPEKG